MVLLVVVDAQRAADRGHEVERADAGARGLPRRVDRERPRRARRLAHRLLDIVADAFDLDITRAGRTRKPDLCPILTTEIIDIIKTVI